MHSTLIDRETLAGLHGRLQLRIVDCRFELSDPGAGERAYREAHIAGACYAHLERDLSDLSRTGAGRHPLPSAAALTRLFSRVGIGRDAQVVAYDDAGGMIAARLWWMLQYMGHRAAAVLDGGWSAWRAAGLPVAAGVECYPPAQFQGQPCSEWVVSAAEVAQAPLLVDARAPQRFRGESEPLDPIAGHIPGAKNRFCRDNLDDRQYFRSPARLAADFQALLGAHAAADTVFYCGSGVTACHNLLALAHAGLGRGKLYPGSWSEWCADPARPVARHPDD